MIRIKWKKLPVCTCGDDDWECDGYMEREGCCWSGYCKHIRPDGQCGNASLVLETAPAKRKPLLDGELPLTYEELEEFCEVVCEEGPVTKVTFGGVIVKYTTPYETKDLCDMQGIQYLLERFVLKEV